MSVCAKYEYIFTKNNQAFEVTYRSLKLHLRVEVFISGFVQVVDLLE